MTYGLREGVSFCAAGGRHFFLDRRSNRYFALQEADEQLFARLLGPGFDPVEPVGLTPALTRLLCVRSQDGLTPFALEEAPSRDLGGQAARVRPVLLLRALLAYARVKAQLACRAPARLFDAYAAHKPREVALRQADGALVELGCAFKWVQSWSGEGECLALSLGFARLAYDLGYPVTIVFAVTPRPFGAHCWVQLGSTVLNDTFDRVETFTPIHAI